MKEIIKKYTNGEITVVWKPDLCIHSSICWSSSYGLPEVFKPSDTPWITMDKSTTEKIIEVVKKCPSAALTFYRNNDETAKPAENVSENKVEIIENGPLLVHGNILLVDSKGQQTKKTDITAFCRCGKTHNKPFCDGTHYSIGFKD